MAERLVRLYGPATVSNNLASPTTLFTVPTGKLYTVRLMSAVASPVGGNTPTASILVGKTDLTPPNLVGALTFTTASSAYSMNTQALTTPLVAGETLVGAYTTSAPTPTYAEYQSAATAAWHVADTTDGTSYSEAAFTPQTMNAPGNLWFLIVNTKAASPDAVSSISDAHTNGATSFSSYASAASATTRVSIWGGYFSEEPSSNAAYTVTFGGTQTSGRIFGLTTKNVASVPGEGGSSSVLQTATNTGTTATVQGVTMTPLQDDSIQLFVVATEGSSSSYTGPTNSTELADGTLATPTSTAAAYIINPSVSNPSATIGVAGNTYAVACIEIARGGLSNLTLSGIVIE